MTEISATEAARRFADVLDAVEHRGESFTVQRRGKDVATITPARKHATWADLKRVLDEHPVDEDFARDVMEAREYFNQPPRDPWAND